MRAHRHHKIAVAVFCLGIGCGSGQSTTSNDASNAASSQASSTSAIGTSSSASTASHAADGGSIDVGDGAAMADAASHDAAPRDATGEDGSSPDAALADASSSVEGDGGDSGAVSEGPSSFHCVNWADERDNFVNGLLQPSGLSSASDTYTTVQAKADAILSAFETDLEANAIRIPINEPTVAGTWWNAYKGIIDTATAKGMKVVIAYWAYQNGKPDSVTAYDAMWKVVVDAYEANPLVYFDIHNEPYGYSSSAWVTFAENWLSTFPTVPKDHIIIAGTGYDQNVNPVGSDAKLDGTLLSLHVYTFFSTGITTAAGWESNIKSNVGTYSSRTIATEWGSPMTTGTNYDVTTDGDSYISYMNGVPDQLRAFDMGSCFWPGLRIGDSWSITTLQGTGTNLSLSVTNASGLERIHWAWGL
jgi:endoglucanase